jgi:hypothetical protein
MRLEHHGAEPESVQTCLIFDPANGRILHTHHVVTLPGALPVSREEVERRAWKRAADAGLDPSRLAAIHVDSERLNRSASYRVDVPTMNLVAIERPFAALSAPQPRKRPAAPKRAAKAVPPKPRAKTMPRKGKPAGAKAAPKGVKRKRR